MQIKQKENFDPTLRKQLQEYVYDILGIIQAVHNEYQHHPIFRGKPMEAFLKMDLMVPRSRGNIIIECKAIETLTSKEYQQLFSYMLGTEFPVGILVNFHGYPKVTIHKFYYDRTDHTITAF